MTQEEHETALLEQAMRLSRRHDQMVSLLVQWYQKHRGASPPSIRETEEMGGKLRTCLKTKSPSKAGLKG